MELNLGMENRVCFCLGKSKIANMNFGQGWLIKKARNSRREMTEQARVEAVSKSKWIVADNTSC